MRWIGVALAAALLLPVPAAAQQGVPTVLGTLYKGSSSGLVTVQPQAAAGTWNWNWPTSAGTSGFLLTSGGGGSAALTWTSPSTTVNGQTCTLGSTCTITASAGTITVGTTTVAGGADTRILFDNAGVLGNYTISGTGNVAMTTSPTIASPTITGAFTATGLVTNADLANASMTIGGQSISLGGATTNQGTGGKIQLSTGTTTTDNCAKFDASGNVIDAGASCGSGSGSVTSVATSGGLTGGPVTTTGTISCIDAASTVKGCPTPDGTSTHFLNGAGGWTTPAGAGTVTSVTAATPNGTLSLGGTNPVTASGTINFDLNLSHANTWAAAQTFTNSDLLLLGSSTGATTFTSANAGASNFTLTVPARTATLGTTTGTLTSGNCVKFDASGNSIDAGAPCGTGNVVGPGSSTAGHFAIFDGTSGQLLKDTLAAPGTAATVNTGTSGATIPLLNGTNVWSAQQSGSVTTLSISTATFTPDGSNNDYSITLVHASCPCTLANPSATPVAGTHGVIYVIQSSTGSDTIGTYGSQYLSAGGTSTITLSTGANAIDVFSYAVKDSTHIVLSPILNVSH